MKVELLTYTNDPEGICSVSSKVCHTDKYSKIMNKKVSPDILNTIIKSKHFSILEHAVFSFYIVGLSRVATHQLVRHRLMSFAQLSNRYVKISPSNFVFPESIKSNKHANAIYREVLNKSEKAYFELLKLGIKKEDARFVIPQSAKSNIVVTSNARELLHFFELRITKQAQWEIRQLALLMLDLVVEVAPTIFSHVKNNIKEV